MLPGIIILATLSPGPVAILSVILLIALMPLLTWGVNVLIRAVSGWKLVRERFPAKEHQKSGDTYKRQFCSINRGITSFQFRGTTVGVVPAGVYLYPSFARRDPCFIPWSRIRRAAVRGASIHVTVEYEQMFDFTLPYQALPVLEAHLEPGMIQHLPSVASVVDGLLGRRQQREGEESNDEQSRS